MNRSELIGALLITILIIPITTRAQENYKTISKVDSSKFYFGTEPYQVKTYDDSNCKKRPKNVILLIGDGMGATQIYAAMTANRGNLFIRNFTNIGFQTTYSIDNYITDSAAGGTALSSGKKTYNGAIGVDTQKKSIPNIREEFEQKGKATGVVSTSAVTHATPASFVAHQSFRESYEAIAADYLKTNIDVFIGGGYTHFTKRADGKDLTTDLKAKGYQVLTTIEDVQKVNEGKLAALLAPEHIAQIDSGRGNMLEVATETALRVLSNDPDGFFLMVEGSQIDWGGHQNDTRYVIQETLDFDKAIGKALEFAAKDRETLIVITADHETGGLAIKGGNITKGNVVGAFSSGDHTAVMVPVFAFGPGAEQFCGFYENIDIPKKIRQLFEK